jgi:protein SCO1/2
MVAVFALTTAVPLCLASADPQKVDRTLEGWMVGKFTLTDHRGSRFTQEQLRDKWTFILLGDSRCGEPCTSALSALAGMFSRIARTEVVKITQVVFVSLDPEHDSKQTLGRYLARFDSRFLGATGSAKDLQRLVEDLSPAGTQAARSPGSLLLIGPDGNIRGQFLPPYDVAQFTARFLKMRIGR